MRSLIVLLIAALPAVAQSTVVKKETTTPVPIVIDVHIVITITVDVTPGPTPPPNPPPPPPPPPPPADPLVKSLVDAGTKDNNFDQFPKLATGFTNGLAVIPTATTAGDLQTKLTKVLSDTIGKGTITPTVRGVLDDQLHVLNTLLPITAPNATLTDAVRQQITDLFTKLAAACKAASK